MPFPFFVGQNDLGVEYNFLFHTIKTLQEVTLWVPLIFVSLLSKKPSLQKATAKQLWYFTARFQPETVMRLESWKGLAQIYSCSCLSALIMATSYSQPLRPSPHTRAHIGTYTHIHYFRLEYEFMLDALRAKHNGFHFSGLQINQVEKHRVNADMNKLFQVTPFTISPILLHQECTSCTG